jgi:hypothetical protein
MNLLNKKRIFCVSTLMHVNTFDLIKQIILLLKGESGYFCTFFSAQCSIWIISTHTPKEKHISESLSKNYKQIYKASVVSNSSIETLRMS